jgi:hypothetical protein
MGGLSVALSDPSHKMFADTVSFRDSNGKEFFCSHPGPQSMALNSTAFEVLYGGARGGGKTAALIAWLCLGNRDLPPDHPCHVSYLNHKNFRALVLRRDATDLKEFIAEATTFFSYFGLVGGKSKDDPPIFKFASGATIYTNHLKNEDAFEKYKGWNLHKVGIEELTLIETQRSYLKVLGSVRSVFPEIRPQIFCTTNPDGNGSPWVRKRFVYVIGVDGKRIPWGTKMRDPLSGLTRVFIPAKLSDNPSLGADYKAVMMLQDEKTRRAWLDGDWDALTGNYFSGFRPNGPLSGEPPEANHVIPGIPAMLMPWWPRHIGVDWGFKHNAAAYWLCQNEDDDRLHVYRELVQSGLGSEQLGAKIANESIPDLIGQSDLQIPLYLSHDAFSKQDVTKTRAELIQAGIETVLGSGSTVLLGNGSNVLANEDDLIEVAQTFDQEARIIIHRAGKERIGVWQYLRSLLRFEPLMDLGQPNPEYAKRLLDDPDGFIKYEQYLNAFIKRQEVLPGILFWNNCPRLIEAMSSAIHNDNKPEDILEDGKLHSNDELDALRHALMFIRKLANEMPKRAWMDQRLKKASDYMGDPNIMRQVYAKAERDYSNSHGSGDVFRLPRASGRVQ